MKKSILNIGLLLTISLAVVNFTSCNNDEPDRPDTTVTEIRATNITGNTSGVETVKLIGDWMYRDDEFIIYTISQAPFVNNGFTLNLPATLDDRFLFPMWGEEEAEEGVTISDKEAKIFVAIEFFGFDSAGNPIGDFAFIAESDEISYIAAWLYADRNFSMTGEIDGERVDMSFRKGWNIMYSAFNETEGLFSTTQKPAGVEFEWSFYRYGDTRAKSLRSVNSLFAR